MRCTQVFLSFVTLAALTASLAPDASACGGCFVSQSESTQVTGHKMILTVSKDQTTLYDQITYSGDPAEFAWVLPIHGQVQIGLSSDALFQLLEQSTSVTIDSPYINCGSPQFCGDGFAGAGGQSAGEGPDDDGVTVIAQEVVGPYETVQLAAEDPAALSNWLDLHGYNIPDEIQPIIDAYVNDGFGFLAIRLVPGQGISSMKPVRVTSPGAGPALPLRMVAAGTGAVTPITLFVLSEGRYEPTNFPSFTIDPQQLVWDWDAARSNYSDLRTQGFAATNGRGWLMEAAEPTYSDYFWALESLVEYDPASSGYGDAETPAPEALQQDLSVLTAGLDPNSMWITRMSAELSRAALTTDLALGASHDQTTLQRYFQTVQSVGTPPQCPPPPPPCDDGYGEGGGVAAVQVGGGGMTSCAAAPGSANAAFGAFALGAVGLGLVRRRRAKQR